MIIFWKGDISEQFWKDIRDHYLQEFGDYDAPDGYTARSIFEDGDYQAYWGIDVAYISDSGADEFSIKDIICAEKKIRKDYPKVTPKLLLGSNCEG